MFLFKKDQAHAEFAVLNTSKAPGQTKMRVGSLTHKSFCQLSLAVKREKTLNDSREKFEQIQIRWEHIRVSGQTRSRVSTLILFLPGLNTFLVHVLHKLNKTSSFYILVWLKQGSVNLRWLKFRHFLEIVPWSSSQSNYTPYWTKETSTKGALKHSPSSSTTKTKPPLDSKKHLERPS